MKLDVKRIEKEAWHVLAGPAHEAVFKEAWEADAERIDFTLITTDPNNTLVQYATIRELDCDTAYIQYGGSFPSYRGTTVAFDSFRAILAWLFEHYKGVTFLTQNNNYAMLKFAIKERFEIVGMRTFRGNIMLEHLKMREGK